MNRLNKSCESEDDIIATLRVAIDAKISRMAWTDDQVAERLGCATVGWCMWKARMNPIDEYLRCAEALDIEVSVRVRFW